MKYINFDLDVTDHIQTATEDQFSVRVIYSPVGEQDHNNAEKVGLPLDIRNEIGALRRRTLSKDEIKVLGKKLGEALFPPSVRSLLEKSLIKLENDEGLRIRLRLDTYSLADIPWEYVYISGLGPSGFLALDSRVSIVRYESQEGAMVPVSPSASPLRMVAFLASPDDPNYIKLDVAKEQQNIKQFLDKVPEIHAEFYPDATADTLLGALAKPAHIFHFAGHGEFKGDMSDLYGSQEGAGAVILLDDKRKAKSFSAEKLATNLNSRNVRLAVLTACEVGQTDAAGTWAGVVTALTHAGIPAVVGMQFSILDQNAIAFSRAFYRSIAAGQPIEAAVADGRIAIYSNAEEENERDWGVPVLYLRAENGVLFPKASQTDIADQVDKKKVDKKTCFVVMGYGIKTDYSNARSLDLDKTYKNIIKPAAEEAGLECWRADEIRHSGIIDIPMFKYLIDADIVIADLSTYNSNAFYELGVRHALKPFTTIVIAEKELKYPFDVNHIAIRQYEHLGKDIGFDEVVRFRKEITEAILAILSNPQIDSPVYTFLSNLKPPEWLATSVQTDKKHKRRKKRSATDNKEQHETLAEILEQAQTALDSENDFLKAKTLFEFAHTIDMNNSSLLLRMALATYKSKYPTNIEALNEALAILAPLKPEDSTDPETLGIAGAIYKKLWEETGKEEFLFQSIYFYERGFYLKKDYYNGINLAYLLDVRGGIATDSSEGTTDHTLAKRVRLQVVDICKKLLNSDFESINEERYWVLATLEEAYYALQMDKEYQQYMGEAKEFRFSKNWQRKTTEEQKLKLKKLLDIQLPAN